MAHVPLFRRTAPLQGDDTQSAASDDGTGDIPTDWYLEVDRCLSDALMFMGLPDVLTCTLSQLEANGRQSARPSVAVEGLGSTSRTEMFSQQWDSNASNGTSELLSPTFSEFSAADSFNQDLEPSLLSPPGSLGSYGYETPTSPGASPSNGDTGNPRSRPVGKYPLFPNGRCPHKDHWTRLRSKRAYSFFLCNACGVSWCALKQSKAMDKTKSRSSFMFPPAPVPGL